MNNATLLWFLVSLIFFILEMGHPTLFFFLSFALAALATGIAALWVSWFTHQLFIFFISSILFIGFFKRYTARLHTQKETTNIDALIGKQVTVLTDVTPSTPGTVSFDGTVWTAYTQTGLITKGSKAIIERVGGTHVFIISAPHKIT